MRASDDARFEHVVERVRARTEERRAAGLYPADLEERLEAQYAAVLARRRVRWEPSLLRRAVAALSERTDLGRSRIRLDSRLPGGSLLHRGIAKAVTRQTQGVLEQVAEFAAAAREAIEEVLQGLERHSHDDLEADVAAVHERLATVDRAASGLSLAGLLERVEILEEIERRRGFRPRFSRLDLDGLIDRATGPADRQARLAAAAAAVHACSAVGDAFEVVDLGCGRGDLLAMLVSKGVAAVGVDDDPEAVHEAQARGLTVHNADVMTWLRSCASGTIGAATMVDVAEELEPQELLDVIEGVATALVPGGWLVMVASMPLAWTARTLRSVVPTWRQAVQPEYLTFLVESTGLRDLRIEVLEGGLDFLLVARK